MRRRVRRVVRRAPRVEPDGEFLFIFVWAIRMTACYVQLLQDSLRCAFPLVVRAEPLLGSELLAGQGPPRRVHSTARACDATTCPPGGATCAASGARR